MNQKRIIFLSILIIGVLTLSLGVTFAIFNFNKTSTNSKLVVGDIYMHYNEINQLTIENAMPFEGNKYFHNSDISEEEVNICVSYLTSIWGAEEVGNTVREGETYASFCDGTGTNFGYTFQKLIDTNGFGIEQLIYLEDNNIIKSAYSNLPYFEFTINGKNTTLDKNIYYEVKLDHGDMVEGKQTRIEDNLLKFALIEYNNNIPKRILTDYSFPNLENQVIWSNTIDSETNEEIERTYRLYMWIDSNIKICSGELTTDCDYYTNQDPNWEDVFASIKVNVSGDFIEKNVHYNVLKDNILSEIEVSKENVTEINFLNLSDEEINNRYQVATFKSNGVNPLYAGDNIKIWLESDTEDDTKYIMYIASDETIYFPSNSYGLFAGFTSVKNINFSNINTSNVTNMESLFYKCSSLTSLDLSSFDTSEVSSMSLMFYICSSLTSLDLSSFDTSKVSNMFAMFYKCQNLTSINLSSFDTSQVTNTAYMFMFCSNLTGINLSSFNTSKVTNMYGMFMFCSNLTSLDINQFNTSNVIDFGWMFGYCEGLTFLDISNFDTRNATKMNHMFFDCKNLTNIDVSNFNTSKVTDMTAMFAYCNDLTSLDLSNFDTSKVTGMGGMFRDCVNLILLDVSNFNTSKVTNMVQMFYNCRKVTNLNVSNFDTSKVTDMQEMFCRCISLVSLDVSNFDTSQVTTMRWMFDECTNLRTLDVSNFNTSNVTDMYAMFSECANLISLDLNSFNTGKVTNMDYMFNKCSSLVTIYSNNDWNNTTVESSEGMFSNCTNLVGAISYDVSKVTVLYANPLTGYFTEKN